MHRLSPKRTVVTSFNPKVTSLSSSLSLSSSSSSATTTSCGSTSYNYEDSYEVGDWVLCVTANKDRNVVCALSNGEVQLYDRNTMHLLQTYLRKDSLVTEMTFETLDTTNVFAATATDGSLTLYDTRQSCYPSIQFQNMLRPEEEALTLSMGFDGNITAVGSSKGKIHFFDIRTQRGILGSYTQSHTDEVTRVRFQTSPGVTTTTTTTTTRTTTTPILVSGSEDGLACLFDTSQPTEESALRNVLPVQEPIREIGFFGPTLDSIYCLTGSESMKLYHKDDPVCRKDFGIQFRDQLNDTLLHQQQQQQQSSSLLSTNVVPNNNMLSSISPMEYLVDCHWDHVSQELTLLAGSTKGDATLFQVVGDHNVLSPLHYLHGGHRGVIRAWHTLSPSSFSSNHPSSLFLTVGEDARMCEWNRSTTMTMTNVNDGSWTMSNGGGASVAAAGTAAGTLQTPQIIVSTSHHHKRSGPPLHRGDGVGGGKLRKKPRSRFPNHAP